MSEPKIVALGKVLREWGLKGEVKFRSFNPDSSIYSKLKTIYVDEASGWRALAVASARRHGNTWILQFAEFTEPEGSRVLRGKLLGIPREDLPRPKKDEIYVADLVGVAVYDADDTKIGTIRDALPVGGSEVLKIERESGAELLIPFQEIFVARLDMKKRELWLSAAADELLTL